MTTLHQRMKVAAMWRQIQENRRSLDRNAIELLTHPDATPEQIQQAREILMHVRATSQDAINIAFEKGITLRRDK